MNHLNTSTCECGHQMTARDKTSQLTPVRNNRFYGGNVKAVADAKCPECEKEYQIWLRQHKNSWQVVALVPTETTEDNELSNDDGAAGNDPNDSNDETDEFESMDRDALKEWLDAKNVEYTQNWGEKRLRELCREYVLSASV